MPTQHDKLETLFDKVRALTQEEQEAAVEALTMITDAPYVLSQEELSVLDPALARAENGEFVSEKERDSLLAKPWA